MGCDRIGSVLHAYFDNELDPIAAAEFERHLAQCAECTQGLEALKSLRSAFNAGQLYQKTPKRLRKRIRAEMKSARTLSVMPASIPKSWLALAAALILLALTAWQVVIVRRSSMKEAVLAAEIVDAHLRSLQPGHLTDMVSTDQHTVKPWFDGKLDFSPPVKDFAEQGFSLQGGRLDVVQGRTIAAVVYARRKHFVNVFIWPSSEKEADPRSGSRQGYQWIDWRKGGMEFCAVADTAAADLKQLQRLLSD